MSDGDSPSPKPATGRSARVRVALVAAVVGAALIAVSALATAGDARSTNKTHRAPAFIPACTQRRGPQESVGDLNIKLKTSCAKGQKPLKLALYPVAAAQGPQGPQGPRGPVGPPGPAGSNGSNGGTAEAGEYAVANVFVSRGGAAPKIWATYSASMGSPIGTTLGGMFRFTCSASQAPCKVSIAAAVLSHKSGKTPIYPRVLIYKEDGQPGPEVYCEYADGANNNGGLDTIDRMPIDTNVTAIHTPLGMGVGTTLDCGPNQSSSPANGPVTDISVPAASNGASTASYDVWTNFGVR